MNEATSQMIKTLHARLNDLQIVVDKCPQELAGYDKKLDKIDDQVWALIVDIEKRIKAIEEAENLPKFNVVHGSPESVEEGVQASEASSEAVEGATQVQAASAEVQEATQPVAESAAASDSSSEKRVLKGGIFNEDYELTPKAKETIGNAAQTFGSFLKDAKEMTSEFSGLKKDLDETLDFLPKGKFRR